MAQVKQAEDARRIAEARVDDLRQKLAAAAAEEDRLRQARARRSCGAPWLPPKPPRKSGWRRSGRPRRHEE